MTFYFADSSHLQFNSAVAADVTSPTSGPYAGVSMFEAANLPPSPFVFDDSQDMNLDGLIYLPSRDMTFNSGSHLTNKRMTLVAKTLILDKTNWNLQPAASATVTAGAPGVPELSQ